MRLHKVIRLESQANTIFLHVYCTNTSLGDFPKRHSGSNSSESPKVLLSCETIPCCFWSELTLKQISGQCLCRRALAHQQLVFAEGGLGEIIGGSLRFDQSGQATQSLIPLQMPEFNVGRFRLGLGAAAVI